MAITVELQYGVTFGKCDSSDWIDWEIDLDGEAEEAYKKAKKLRCDLNNVEILQEALSDVYEEIEEQEIVNSMENGDEYVLECQGKLPVDPDEINYLVADRDEHTLEFFGLTEMTDEELEEWDANDLAVLPDVCDFDDNFKPYSPYDEGWSLNVVYAEHPEDNDIEEAEARETISELLDEGDFDTLKQFIKNCKYLTRGKFKMQELANEIVAAKGIGKME